MYIYIHTYTYLSLSIYIYIYIYMFSSSRKRPDVFVLRFHRRDSRGPVAAGNHNKTTETMNKRSLPRRKPLKTNDGNHKQTFSCHDGNPKKTATETSPKNTTNTRNRSIHSNILDSPAAAESTTNPATEIIKQKTCFPATTEIR